MFAIYVIGMAILMVVSGSLSYVLSIGDLLIISSLSFLTYYFVLGKRKVFLWILASITLSGLATSIYLYKNDLLTKTFESIMNYLRPYYYSVKVSDYYIGELHQFVLIICLGILLYKFIAMFYHSSRFKFLPPIVGFLFILGAYFAGTFSSDSDRYAFLMFVIACFVYYFEIYYMQTRLSEGIRKRYSFYILATIMAVTVLVFASLVNDNYSNPFMKRVKVQGVTSSDTNRENTDSDIEQLELIYPITDDYTVASNFEHKGILLFRVKSDKLKYYKGQTFNEFSMGKWTNTKTNQVDIGTVIEPVLSSPVITSEDIFYNEEVEVIYQNIYTDSIITGPYTKEIIFDEQVNAINLYENGMYKTENMVGKDFTYTLSIAIPKYGTNALMNYMNTLETETIDLSEYLNIPDGYDELASLALNISKDYTTNIDKAMAIETYLKTTFDYSEEPDFRPGQDMINEFLFETKEGFCQQFATTMALMLRSIDIPSRFVTGYVVSSSEMEIDELPEELLYLDRRDMNPYKSIYDYDAHTWVEIYVPSFGWMQFEPTPGQSSVQFSNPREFNNNLNTATEQTTFHTIITHDYFEILLASFIIFITLLILFLFIRRGLVLKKNIRKRLFTNYKLILMYLKAIKIEKKDYETLREYSKRIDKRLSRVQQEFKNCVPILEEAFYNDVEPTIEEIEMLESLLDEIKASVKRIVVPITYRRLRVIEVVRLHK